MTGTGERHIIRRGLEFAYWLAVDLGRRNDACEVVRRVLPSLPRHFLEEVHIGEGGIDQVIATLHLRIATAEISSGDVEQSLTVLIRNSENQHDDLERIPPCDIL